MPRGARAGRRGPHNISPNPFAVNAAHYTEPSWASPLLHLILGDPAEPSTWTEATVQTITPDIVRAEGELAKSKTPAADHPLQAMVASAYFALVRTGAGSGSLQDFLRHCIDVDVVANDAADPTPADPWDGS